MAHYELIYFIPIYSLAAIGIVNNLFHNNGLLDFYPNWINRITQNEKIHKVTYDCEPCISGQLALWSTLFLMYHSGTLMSIVSLYVCLLLTLATIGLTYFLIAIITTYGEDI